MAASFTTTWRCAFLALLFLYVSGAYGQLSPTFYSTTCPNLATIVHDAMVTAMNPAVGGEPRMGASLLRLHFHDCFVQGCDGSVLLDDVPATGFFGEKTAFGNINSVRGFEVINTIKANVEAACPDTVSCADILALAARDGIVLLNGPTWTVPLGRRDSMNASADLANRDLPPPFANLASPDGSGLIARFQRKGLSAREMTALSGAHTIGFAQCQNYRDRIYNEPNIDPVFAENLKANCTATGPAGNTFLSPFDPTGTTFDNKYYESLAARRGLIHSDQVLYNPGPLSQTSVVNQYRSNNALFLSDFVAAMIKMGNLSPPPGTPTQIRTDCRFVNP